MAETILRKSLWAALAISISLLAWFGTVDSPGKAFADESFKRALYTFAASRALNGAISVAQGTEIALEPGGVGIIIAIGEALDPINDMVEQFSTVMLIATSSLALQNVLLTITSWWGVTALVLATGLFVVASTFLPGINQFASLARRLLLITVFLRFAMPVLVIGTTWVFDTFLAAEQEAATAALQATTVEIETINNETDKNTDADQSLLDRLDAALDNAWNSIQIGDRLDRLQESLSNASEHIINLIVIFLLQTLALPVIFLWLIADALKSIAARTIAK
jgi:hypothetical protein